MNSPWDERYRNQEGLYGAEPNAFFAEALRDCVGHSMLLPCDGEGRNAVFAAKQGWNVWSFDASQVGVTTSIRWAEEAGVTIHSVQADAFEYTPPNGPVDVVGLFYAHMPESMRNAFHRRALSWVKPGGLIILEGFHTDQLQFSSGGPKDLAMLLTPEILESDFDELTVLQNQSLRVKLNEGPLHQGAAAVCRFIGQKPQSTP
ncbi:MAG: class I SAM-dependent methyltransferase [Flavobacteriales bacterium]|nr:class I SAM-dependent methyltransferase [Flavobacteriales bacterium]